jgi:single-strand DNA-binding protein
MLNVICLMGRLVADPELRHTPNGVATCTFRIAVDRSYARAGEERKADFIDIVAWRQSAEFVCKYFHKGSMIAVNGSLQTRNYEDRNGNKRTAYEVVADNIHFAESKGVAPAGGGYAAPAAQPVQRAAAAPVSYAVGNADDFAVIDDNEDLPF